MHAIEVRTKNDSNEQIEQIIKNTSGLTADNLKDTYYNIGENKLIELNLTYRVFNDVIKPQMEFLTQVENFKLTEESEPFGN